MARVRQALQQKAGKQLPQGAGTHSPSHASSHLKSGRAIKRKNK